MKRTKNKEPTASCTLFLTRDLIDRLDLAASTGFTTKAQIMKDALEYYADKVTPPHRGNTPAAFSRSVRLPEYLFQHWKQKPHPIQPKMRGAISAWLDHIEKCAADLRAQKALQATPFQAAKSAIDHKKELAETDFPRHSLMQAGRYVIRTPEGTMIRRMSTRKAYTFAAKHGWTVEDTAVTQPPLPPMPEQEYMKALEQAQKATEDERDLWTMPEYIK